MNTRHDLKHKLVCREEGVWAGLALKLMSYHMGEWSVLALNSEVARSSQTTNNEALAPALSTFAQGQKDIARSLLSVTRRAFQSSTYNSRDSQEFAQNHGSLPFPCIHCLCVGSPESTAAKHRT